MLRIAHPLLLSVALLSADLAGYAHAAQAPGIYQAEAPVQTQAEGERDAAFKAALENVLIKVTGNRAVMNEPAAKDLALSASHYVQQYGYRERAPMMMWVKFDSAALQAALTQAGLPVWVDERPAVLIWLAVQHQNHRYLIDEDSRKGARQIIQNVAIERGLPMLLPLLDIEDRLKVGVADVLGGFDEAIIEASMRYGADAVAIAAVTRFNGAWRAEWRLNYSGKLFNWSFDGVSLAAVLKRGMNAMADTLSQRLAVVESIGALGGLQVSVEGVNTLEDYARLQRYFANLSLLQGYRLVLAQPNHTVYQVRLSGDASDVGRVIALGDVLETAPLPERAVSTRKAISVRQKAPALHFRLLQ